MSSGLGLDDLREHIGAGDVDTVLVADAERGQLRSLADTPARVEEVG